ncbi:unnamed protein product [Onchocerca ochengi]|uniref:XPGN domain-containing protein n=1 Tax=Onchocerca ochengi TaxID=42157 RepID=A0A182EHB4_ONCOC|nr:unnamed protein product [Onchocerca ochengi]
MGVTSMWEYVQKFVQPVNISALRNKRIAIDGHTWLCEVLRGSVAHCSTARKPYLSTFYTRCRSLLDEGVEPIVVFDGIDEGERANVCFRRLWDFFNEKSKEAWKQILDIRAEARNGTKN